MSALDTVDRYRKAIVAFVAPGAVVITSSVLPSSDGGGSVTAAEWITAACACVITSAAVGGIGNASKSPPAPPAVG